MASDTLRKVHSFTGVVPLAAYLLFHAFEHWPVRIGRDPLLARLSRTSFVAAEVVLVLLPLLVHAALGFKLRRLPETGPSYVSQAFRRLQALTGAMTAVFLLWHLASVWVRGWGEPSRAIVVYDAMLTAAGTTLGASLHVVALSAVCVHLGQGLAAVWLRYRPTSSPSQVRTLSVTFGLALWFVMLNELAAYAAGAPLL